MAVLALLCTSALAQTGQAATGPQAKRAQPAAASAAEPHAAQAPADASQAAADTSGEDYTATMPTVHVVGTAETSVTKGYIGYEEADVTRNQLSVKEVPQTVDVLDIQKNKNYGTNDLSSILEGNAGIDATYDMRGESIFIRGFQADGSDIYRDGVRESGQVRRSTANIERVEILKGPSSVLYGRSAGGGVINMVSKFANFTPRRSVGLAYGSWANRSATFDINQVINPGVAVRLTGEVAKANSWRSTVHTKGYMLSPSITVRAGRLAWTGQYTWDSARRVPDRTPTRDVYEAMGISFRQGFARPGDFVRDDLRVLRSDLSYALGNQWDLRWQLARRSASQNFDHYFGGAYDATRRLLYQSYSWQETSNKTLSSALTLNGRVKTGALEHKLSLGLDLAREERNPTLTTLRNQPIDPFAAPSTWSRIHPRPAATLANRHRAPSLGLFVQDLIALRPDVKVLLGGRYDRYKFRSTNIRGQSAAYSGSSFSPNLGVVWDITPEHTAYASWNKSFAPYGGRGYLGVDIADAATFNADPEESRQIEVGLKSEWLDRQLSTTLSLYNLEHRNIRYRPDPDDLTRWAVRGKERSRGIELSAIGRLHPQWYVRGSLGLMSAKILEDRATPARVGRSLNNTARVSSNLFVRYAPRPWYAEVGVTHLGKRHYWSNQGVEEHLPGFTRVDAMLGFNRASWTFTAAVQNVFNKQYWRSSAMPGSPRAIMVKASYEF
ncbi:TonB-dependent receptor [Comamonadaceae bacterium OH2545_COT-014]|nr:TonB-dependent receptor [Comamonadaceae bacterium OH2545_COT-014]